MSPVVTTYHHRASGVSDSIAFGFTKLLRFCADTFFAKRYGHRAVVLETVAAVPGMVGATLNHLRCLRRMCDDKGWIKTLMDEAENERMHLMTFIEVAKPSLFERFVVVAVQWVFYLFFFALYLISPRTAHRVVGYFEEEAVISYTHYLAEIDEGRSPNVPAPAIARRYWNLPETATLRDVVEVVRADRSTAWFAVDGVEVYPKKGFPDRKVYAAAPNAQLRLITCGGGFTRQDGYDGNVVVYAHLVRAGTA